MEIWLYEVGFPSHEISNYGRVKNKKTGYILKSFSDRHGYLRLSIGSVNNVYVHRLVCETFFGPPDNNCCYVNHIDGNRQNNYYLNLEWCTPQDNIRWGVSHGNINPIIGLEKAREVNLRPVRIIELDRYFSNVKECAEFLGINPNRVSRCLTGERKGQRLHGYHVEYVKRGDVNE